jgi:hypothetical protein
MRGATPQTVIVLFGGASTITFAVSCTDPPAPNGDDEQLGCADALPDRRTSHARRSLGEERDSTPIRATQWPTGHR